jgi:hypothetical protein
VREGDPGAPELRDRSRDPLCFEEYLRHPLQYYRIRGGAVVERGEVPDEPTTAPSEGRDRRGGPGRTRSTGRR